MQAYMCYLGMLKVLSIYKAGKNHTVNTTLF